MSGAPGGGADLRRRRRRLRIVCGLIGALGWSGSAAAQDPGTAWRPLRRPEVTLGGGLMGGTLLGLANASLRPATGATPFRLFTAETRLARVPLAEIRVGTALVRRLDVELRVAYGRPELRTSVTRDIDDAPPLTVVERIDQWIAEGGVLVMFDELRLGPVVPFAAAGAGYVRQLHEGRTVVEEGHLYHVGGGVKHWLLRTRRGALRAAGLRADARVYLLADGFALDDDLRRHVAISGGFFMAF